jgi:hypothetical protein
LFSLSKLETLLYEVQECKKYQKDVFYLSKNSLLYKNENLGVKIDKINQEKDLILAPNFLNFSTIPKKVEKKDIEILSNETKSYSKSPKSKKNFFINPLNSPRIKSPTTPTSSRIPLSGFFKRKNNEDSNPLARSNSDNIIKTLKDEEKRKLFLEYAKTEYSDENIRFWEDVQIFKSLEDLEMKLDKMEEINEKYLTVGSTFEINSTSDLLNDVKTKVFECLKENSANQELFDELLKDIIGGILNDTFSRFRFHESYLNFKQKK